MKQPLVKMQVWSVNRAADIAHDLIHRGLYLKNEEKSIDFEVHRIDNGYFEFTVADIDGPALAEIIKKVRHDSQFA